MRAGVPVRANAPRWNSRRPSLFLPAFASGPGATLLCVWSICVAMFFYMPAIS